MLYAPAMTHDVTVHSSRAMPILAEQLKRLQTRSNARGLLRLGGHLVAIAASGFVYTVALSFPVPILFRGLAALALGFTLVTLFATMHECVHRTAFKSTRLNDSVAWFAGLLSFYNSSFYRPYHGWHHRFTQLPGKDPELEDKKPSSVFGWFVELSALPWWLGKLRTYYQLALGRTGSYHFLTEKTRPLVVRSVRAQLATYGAAIGLSIAFGQPYFVTFWLLPVAIAQPLLRAILLAEHGGCAESADMLSNTRTTYTVGLIRFLMWEMPYHAEHHRYPALPFFSLARAHVSVGPYLAHVERRGYTGFHAKLLKQLSRKTLADETTGGSVP
jgi:fatty acid desaturase